jgi:hypothetical protein
MVPGRDGQPLHVFAHMDLARLAATAAGSRAESRWSLARTVAGPAAWCPTGPAADAAACDATVIPVITGQVDWSLLDDVISLAVLPWAAAHTPAAPPSDPADSPGPVPARNPVPPAPGRPAAPDPAPPGSSAAHDPPESSLSPGGPAGLLTPEVRDRLRQLVIQHATGLLSGPAGLAAQWRAHRPGQPGPAVPVPPPDRHPPLGLDPDLPPRRHHHRHQPRRPHPAQPQPALSRRLTIRGRAGRWR